MVLTDNEKRELALEVLRLLKEQSIGVNELPKATTMDGVEALPAYQTKEGTTTAVTVPINLLGKPAIDAASEAKEVIEQAKGAITDTETALNSVNSAIEKVNLSKDETENATKNAVTAIENLNQLKEAVNETKAAAEKATESAYRASDDADNISDLVSKEWQNIKTEAEKTTETAQTGIQNLNQVLEETNELIVSVNDKLVTKEEKIKWDDKYTKSEVDTKDIDILESAKQYIINRVAEVIGGSPAALDTLYEIANALNNDPAFATTIMALINGKADTVHKHTKSQITDFPTSMPASDVYDWAKAASKPNYTSAEVGAALAIHDHTADQITDTDTKVIMTKEERSKLAGLECKYIPSLKLKTCEKSIFIYHDKLPEQLMKLNPEIVMLRCKKVKRYHRKNIEKAWRWGEIRHTTIGISGTPTLTTFFRFQLSNTGKWYQLKRKDNSLANIDELTKAFIKTKFLSGIPHSYTISFYSSINNRGLSTNLNFMRSGTFALAIRIDNPEFPTSINDRPVNDVEYTVNKTPRYIYSELAKFKLIINHNISTKNELMYSLKLI